MKPRPSSITATEDLGDLSRLLDPPRTLELLARAGIDARRVEVRGGLETGG